MNRNSKKTSSKMPMYAVAVLAVAVSACGAGPSEEDYRADRSPQKKEKKGGSNPLEALGVSLPENTPSLAQTPGGGMQLIPAGWYVHDYPGVCVFLIRDEEGRARRCYSYPEGLACVPEAEGGCLRFELME